MIYYVNIYQKLMEIYQLILFILHLKHIFKLEINNKSFLLHLLQIQTKTEILINIVFHQ